MDMLDFDLDLNEVSLDNFSSDLPSTDNDYNNFSFNMKLTYFIHADE